MRRRGLVLGGVCMLAGCAAGAPVTDYRLAALPGPAQPGGPASIGVRSVGIPGYLDQNGIVKTSSAYEFDTYENEVWAEPLAAMLQAVMVQDLALVLPGASVLASGGAIEAPAAVLVEINVEKFDPDGAGNMVLVAQVAVKDGAARAVLRAATLEFSTPAGVGVLGTVAAMSELWAEAAGRIAMLAS